MKGHRVRHWTGLVAVLSMAINGTRTAAQIDAWTDVSGHRVSFVTVAPTVDLDQWKLVRDAHATIRRP